MIHDEKYIRMLIARFMDGRTTLDEEREIGQWLAQHHDLPADLADYRQMFAYFDQGMPLADDGHAPSACGQPAPRRYRIGRWAAMLAAACVAAAVALVWWHGYAPAETATVARLDRAPYAQQPADSVGRMVATPQPAMADSVKPAPRRVKRHYHKYQYTPAPPRPLVAQADSLPQITDRQIAELIEQAEAEQQELQEYLQAAAAVYEASLLSATQGEEEPEEEEVY